MRACRLESHIDHGPHADGSAEVRVCSLQGWMDLAGISRVSSRQPPEVLYMYTRYSACAVSQTPKLDRARVRENHVWGVRTTH